jgi:WD40 repeat protein
MYSLKGHETSSEKGYVNKVAVVAFSPDDHWMASGDDDGRILLWDLTRREPTTAIELSPVNDIWVRSLKFSPDNKWLIAARSEGGRKATGPWSPLEVWALDALCIPPARQLLQSGWREPNTPEVSVDSHWLIVPVRNAAIELWPLDHLGDKPALLLEGQPGGDLTRIKIDRQGRWLAASEEKGSVRLYDLKSRDVQASLTVLNGNDERISDLGFSPNGHWLVAVCDDGNGRRWELTKASLDDPTLLLRVEPYATTDQISFDPEGGWISSGRLDGGFYFWDTRSDPSNAVLETLPGLGVLEPNAKLQVLTGANLLAWGGSDGAMKLWNLAAGHPLDQPRKLESHKAAIYDWSASDNSRWFASVDYSGHAYLWDLLSKGEPNALPLHLESYQHGRLIKNAAFTHGSHWLLATAWDELWVWDLTASNISSSARFLFKFPSRVDQLILSQDGQRFLICCNNLEAWLGDAAHPAMPEGPFSISSTFVNTMAFSPDGRWLVSDGGPPDYMRYWSLSDLPRSDSFRTPKGPKPTWPGMALFSPDGHWLACAAGEIAELYRMTGDGPEPFASLGVFADYIQAMAFDTKSCRIAIGAHDGVTRIWKITAGMPLPLPVEVPAPNGWSQDLMFSKNGSELISVSYHALRRTILDPEKIIGHLTSAISQTTVKDELRSYIDVAAKNSGQ